MGVHIHEARDKVFSLAVDDLISLGITGFSGNPGDFTSLDVNGLGGDESLGFGGEEVYIFDDESFLPLERKTKQQEEIEKDFHESWIELDPKIRKSTLDSIHPDGGRLITALSFPIKTRKYNNSRFPSIFLETRLNLD